MRSTFALNQTGSIFVRFRHLARDRPDDTINFYGQTKEHAIAIALEHLADEYREKAEESQNIDSLAVEISDSREPINKYYHVIVHYEEISEAESKFEAVHNTMIGNTIVENARIAAIEIAPDIEIEPTQAIGILNPRDLGADGHLTLRISDRNVSLRRRSTRSDRIISNPQNFFSITPPQNLP